MSPKSESQKRALGHQACGHLFFPYLCVSIFSCPNELDTSFLFSLLESAAVVTFHTAGKGVALSCVHAHPLLGSCTVLCLLLSVSLCSVQF
jgi:hypothetical protein